MQARLRKALLFASLAGFIGFVLYDQAQERSGGDRPRNAAARATQEPPQSSEPVAARPGRASLSLPERAPFGEPGTELFAAHSWQPPAPPVVAAAPAPVPPAIPYRFAGTLSQDGEQQVLLSKGDAVFPVKAGETLDGTYKVESIGETEITFQYLPLRHQQSIPVTSSIAVAPPAAQARPQLQPPQATVPATTEAQAGALQPARLAWDGPREVQLGAAFNVSLKVKSAQPVQASPMQIRFDPAVLEPLAVKPGRFFAAAERNFSYRVNADGTIFVGASGAGPVAAADAELLLLTFKAIRAAPQAELALASLSLVGPAGRPIAFEQLAAYRASITR